MILDEIVAARHRSLKVSEQSCPLAELIRIIEARGEPLKDFAAALYGPRIRLIAEVKRASPSKGSFPPIPDVAGLVRTYAAAGTACISVLTEADYFQGSLTDLQAVRSAVDLPLLRKDFILDPYQVYETRAYGADALLLIVAILSDEELRSLLGITQDLGMTALVEVHNQEEVNRALAAGASVIGINNRDLRDFSVDLQTTLRLLPLIPSGIVVVSESGIYSRADVLRLEEAGVRAVLVGESLLTSDAPTTKIRELLDEPVNVEDKGNRWSGLKSVG
ncbi:MAG: indole-3-glycerol phosphate synthase TrpC [Chloroflexi bacterium]|nr:indole-3-glycerol phosphate synthase TrpC [Chloroflexota bacterium]